ncbi:(R)-mandelonitrile lyase [Nonomuraea sp. NPDC004354]
MISGLGRATDNGVTEAELIEAISHLAFYAGWPRAMSAMTVTKDLFRARPARPAKGTNIMELLKRPATGKLPAEWFTGDVFADVIYRGHDASAMRANAVHFTPGARTAWHSHGRGQALYIVEGIALIQSRGSPILRAHPGQVIWTPPGEEHWHGAAPDQFMTHIALWEGDEVTWLDHVTDAEYTSPPTDHPT